MSQFGQRGGRVDIFQKCKNVWNSKMSQRSEGGVNPNWDIVPNFLDFLFWCLPLDAHMIEVLIGESYNSFRILRKEIEPTGYRAVKNLTTR